MILQNLHTHTIYDDGKNTPIEMAYAALSAGLTSLGFSGHSVLHYKNEWAMTEASSREYDAAAEAAKAFFDGRLEIFRGIEWDHTSSPPVGYDFVIGSVHHLTPVSPSCTVDESRAHTERALNEHFHDDSIALAQAYYSQYDSLARTDAVDIVGHFDLLRKFDEPLPLFDESAPAYLDAAIAAMETLLKKDKIFEVNTGAMQRGYRTTPYPSARLLKELLARKARVLITADAHSAEGIAYAFPETEELLKTLGFRETWLLTKTGFIPRQL